VRPRLRAAYRAGDEDPRGRVELVRLRRHQRQPGVHAVHGLTTLVDGRPGDAVPAADRGLQYGDGLFETVAVVDGRPCLWDRHLRRLRDGCERLALPSPDPDVISAEAETLAAGHARAVLKLILTRGDGGRGYRPPRDPRPRRVLALHPWPEYPEAWRTGGVGVRWCATRLGFQPRLAGLKHLNRLEQVLARVEWDDPAVGEGLMLDLDGNVVSGTQSNLFVLHRGTLLTPPVDRCGVAGVARAVALETARACGITVREARLSREDVTAAAALFLTSSLIGVWPVRELDGAPRDPRAVPAALAARIVASVFEP
jgi:4-amino-4-deoxychorismate lyase